MLVVPTTNTTDEIYVALLDEGVDVWRAVPARKVSDDTYLILRPTDYNPEDETWEFQPGSTVQVEQRRIADGVITAAVRLVEAGRQSA